MIESFKIDHTKLEPGVRLAAIYHRDGVDVVKFDIRMIKPNTEYFRDDIMHSMEHLMATAAKEVFGDDMIDLSPMGCKNRVLFNNICQRVHRRCGKNRKDAKNKWKRRNSCT